MKTKPEKEMTEIETAAAASAAHHQQQRKASNAGSDDLLAPLPSNVGGGGPHGRRMSRVLLGGGGGGGRPGQGRGRLGTLAGPSLMLGGGEHGRGQPAPLENTYRMKPEDAGRFNCRQAAEILTSALETAVASVGQKYDAGRCRSACQSAAEQARRELRELDSRRYKLVVSISAVQLLGQAALVASRSVGSPETDSFATARVSASDFACVATVHALYYE